MLFPKEVNTEYELIQINKLNRQNLKKYLSKPEQEEQGFVTWLYPVSLLQQIHTLAPGIIVKDNDAVVGYALVTPMESGNFHTDLKRMIDNLETLSFNGKPLSSFSFYIMGQVCIDKDYRGKGIFNILFQKHKKLYSNAYELLVTEISTKNYRSLKELKKLALLPFTLTAMLKMNGMWWFGIGDSAK
jgi:hypothetical protein